MANKKNNNPSSTYFPCALNVRNRHCAVLGFNHETEDKTGKLIAAEARVTLFAENFPEGARSKFENWGIEILKRRPKFHELKKYFFILNCEMHDHKWNRSLFNFATKNRVLICSIDQPDLCDVVNVSFVTAGRLQIAVGTGGAGPTVSKKMREGLAEALRGSRIENFMDYLASIRPIYKKKYKNPSERRAKLIAAASGFQFSARVKVPRIKK